MKRLLRSLVVLSGCVVIAGCVPIPLAMPAASPPSGDPNRVIGTFACSIDGQVSANWTSTRFTLSTPFGTEELTGVYPNFYGDEITINVVAGTSGFIWSAPGEQQTCTMNGVG